MLTLTYPGDSWAHRWPAGVKMLALCLWTVVLFRLTTPLPLTLTLLATVVLITSCGLSFAFAAMRLLWPLWPFLTFVALWNLLTGDPVGGVVVILRLMTAILAANFVTMTTLLSQMIAVLSRVAAPLRFIGLPPKAVAMAVALVVRFIPVLSQRLADIRDAWRARSIKPPGWRIIVPAVLSALDDADRVAEALRARGGAA